ncbi:MAG: redoxin domain-containing protein [Terracidiphilus sp.]
MTLALLLGPWCFSATERFGVGVDGKPISDLGGPGIRVVVLIFAASDCPISNRYVPEVARLHREFTSQGVHFWWVFPNPQDTTSIVARHDRAFAISESVVLDTQQTLVRKAHATITPESAVFVIRDGSMREVYHGRIDDRYLAFGRERPAPQHHELEVAIAAALAGKPVTPSAGPPVGCVIVPRQS